MKHHNIERIYEWFFGVFYSVLHAIPEDEKHVRDYFRIDMEHYPFNEES